MPSAGSPRPQLQLHRHRWGREACRSAGAVRSAGAPRSQRLLHHVLLDLRANLRCCRLRPLPCTDLLHHSPRRSLVVSSLSSSLSSSARRVACQYIEPLACRRPCLPTFSGVPREATTPVVWASVRVLGAGRVEHHSNGGTWAQGVCRGQSRNRGARERSGGDSGGGVCNKESW